MKTHPIRIIPAFALATSLIFSHGAKAEAVPQALLDDIPALQAAWGSHPDVIAAVRAQNAEGMSLADIQSLDERWQASSGLADFMMPYFRNDTAGTLASLEADTGYVVESFVMDNQGAIVAATNKTSDFWQGDEAKFTDSFKQGKGAVHIGDVEFDDSAQAYLVQVSIPVLDDGAAIGAITIGIDIGAFD